MLPLNLIWKETWNWLNNIQNIFKVRYPCPLFSADDLNRDIFVSSSLQRIQERRSSQFLPGLNSASWSLPFCPTRRSKPRDWFNEFLKCQKKCQRIPRILKLVTFHVWLSHEITWKLFGCTRPINCLIGSALIWKSDGLRPCTATIHCSLNLMIYLYLPRKKKAEACVAQKQQWSPYTSWS